MNALFTLYRYLASGRGPQEGEHTLALRSLESLLDLVVYAESWGTVIEQTGSLDSEEAEGFLHGLTTRLEDALFICHQSSPRTALLSFAENHLAPEDYDAAIAALEEQKHAVLKDQEDAVNFLGDLDDHPF